MADEMKNRDSLLYVSRDMSGDAMRKQLLQGQTDTTVLSAMTEALELYSFMGKLPDVLVASQKREAKRLAKSSKDNTVRIEALNASLEQAAQLNDTFRSGQSRVDRSMAAVLEPNDVFHGFVSGPELQARQGYTVRLVGADGKPRLSAVTETDGYFSITLKAKEKKNSFPAKDETETALLGGVLQLFGMRNPFASQAAKESAQPLNKGAAAAAADKVKDLASVEILDARGERVQQDPIPVDLNSGTVYREYMVESDTDQVAPKRYVGNSAKYEIHDSTRLTKQCNFDAISAGHKVYFDSTAEAEKAGYDYCAYCFGRKMSKR